jgi:hypothetical protein
MVVAAMLSVVAAKAFPGKSKTANQAVSSSSSENASSASSNGLSTPAQLPRSGSGSGSIVSGAS